LIYFYFYIFKKIFYSKINVSDLSFLFLILDFSFYLE
jgi:hypothetical protein